MRLVDVRNEERERAISAFVVDDDILVDPGPESAVANLLDALDGWRPRAIALTHIHLDHAGATGALLEHWPKCEVWVHERGARHLSAPERLIASARQVYGERLATLFGGMRPVPARAIRTVGEGDRVDPFDVIHTPGHAGHHVVYSHRDTGAAYVGDLAGVRIPPAELVLVPTVAPDFDPPVWQASIRRLAELRPTRLALTHFGFHDDVDRHLAVVHEGVARWAAAGRDLDEQEFTAAIRAAIAAAGDPATQAAYEQAGQPDRYWAGARQYWERLQGEAERVGPSSTRR